jgi:hypothetical protein
VTPPEPTLDAATLREDARRYRVAGTWPTTAPQPETSTSRAALALEVLAVIVDDAAFQQLLNVSDVHAKWDSTDGACIPRHVAIRTALLATARQRGEGR